MNREQRIKQLEEKVDEMINNLSKNVAEAVKGELRRMEAQKQWDEAIKANEAKEMWLKIERRKLDLMAFGRGVKLSPPQLLINCPHDGHCCNQFGTDCLVCEHNPQAFKTGDWIRCKHEGRDEKLFQLSFVEKRSGELFVEGQRSHTGGYTITNLKDCKKWEPRKGEKVIANPEGRKGAFIGIYDRPAYSENYHLVSGRTMANIIPFISIEQFDKIIKGE